MPDGPMGFEPSTYLAQIERPVALMDLHRVAPAQGYVRTCLSREVDKVALLTGAAIGSGFHRRNLRAVVGPHVEGKQSGP